MIRERLPPLTPAQETLVLDNQRLVWAVVHKLRRGQRWRLVPSEDLAGAGFVALVRAAHYWKAGISAFSTYATWAIWREVLAVGRRVAPLRVGLFWAATSRGETPPSVLHEGDDDWGADSTPLWDSDVSRPRPEADAAELVRTSLAALDPLSRRLVEARHLRGLTLAQAAAEAGVSVGLAETTLRLALEVAAKVLVGEW